MLTTVWGVVVVEWELLEGWEILSSILQFIINVYLRGKELIQSCLKFIAHCFFVQLNVGVELVNSSNNYHVIFIIMVVIKKKYIYMCRSSSISANLLALFLAVILSKLSGIPYSPLYSQLALVLTVSGPCMINFMEHYQLNLITPSSILCICQ